MRYWHPLIEKVVPELYDSGIRKLIVLSLYPQYSVATTGSSLNKLQEVTAKYGIEIFSILSWFDHPLYIDAIVDEIKKGLKAFNSELRTPNSKLPEVHVLFSAHSLPVKFIEEGDPYVDQIKGTINEIIKKIDISWSLSYQSKSGPVKWLGPSTDKMIEDLAEKGVKNLLVVPISFVSDHIETLYEIDILYKKMAEALGMRLERVESLNTSPLFISAMQDIVLKGMKEAGWAE
jgi:ferrochelatase